MTIDDVKNVFRARCQQAAPTLGQVRQKAAEAWGRTRSTARARPRTALAAAGVLGLALLVGFGGEGGVDDARDAAVLCVEALRDGDFDAMQPLLLTADDIRAVVDSMGTDQRERLLKEMESKGGIEQIAARQQDRLRRSFEEVRREGEGCFPWKDVELVSVHVEPRKENDGPDVSRADVTAVLDHDGRRYTLSLHQSKTPRGWVCERLRFRAP